MKISTVLAKILRQNHFFHYETLVTSYEFEKKYFDFYEIAIKFGSAYHLTFFFHCKQTAVFKKLFI